MPGFSQIAKSHMLDGQADPGDTLGSRYPNDFPPAAQRLLYERPPGRQEDVNRHEIASGGETVTQHSVDSDQQAIPAKVFDYSVAG